MSKYKPDQGLLYQNHDLAAINMIERMRRHPVRRIEDSKAFLLTSDGKLSQFDFIELGHKESSTVCEVPSQGGLLCQDTKWSKFKVELYNGPVKSDTLNEQNRVECEPCENTILTRSKPKWCSNF